jgi:hypothetical protein
VVVSTLGAIEAAGITETGQMDLSGSVLRQVVGSIDIDPQPSADQCVSYKIYYVNCSVKEEPLGEVLNEWY